MARSAGISLAILLSTWKRVRSSAGILICRFFFNDTATTEIYTLSLHDALPISLVKNTTTRGLPFAAGSVFAMSFSRRSEEHTSELQSRQYIVCRLLLEKKQIDRLLLHRSSLVPRHRAVQHLADLLSFF